MKQNNKRNATRKGPTLGEVMAEDTRQVATILRHEAMDAASVRLPHVDMVAARAAARMYRCQLADIIRTAVHDWLGRIDLGKEAE